MATAQLYHHCAPSPEVQVVAKAMIRLLRSHDEVQAVVLNAIASMTSSRRKSRNSMFEPFLREVCVNGTLVKSSNDLNNSRASMSKFVTRYLVQDESH